MNDVGVSRVEEKIVYPLKDVKVATYYGCLLIRPPEIVDFDDPERPVSMDRLFHAAGAEVLQWDMKARCCGGPILLTQRKVALELSWKILSKAKELGADCLVLPCPMCHMNLDAMQHHVQAGHNVRLDIPVLFFTQMLGLAMGIHPRELGLNRNVVSPKRLISKVI